MNGDLNLLISVVIPVYNNEKYLKECLDSVLGNTYQNLEIICVDDGSTDSSPEIIRNYSKTFSNVKLLTQKNSGVSAARNAGLKNSHGDYIAFIDSDDTISSVFFERMMNACELNHADIAVCRFNKDRLPDINTYTGEFHICNSSEYYRDKHSRIYVTTKLFRREILNDVFFEKSAFYAEDIAYSMDILCGSIENGHTLVCALTRDEMYYYRQNESSLTHTYVKEDWIPLCKYLEKRSETSKSSLAKSLYSYDALKKYLVLWYDAFIQKDKEIQKYAKTHMKTVRKSAKYEAAYMDRMDYISIKTFSAVPGMYSLFRKLNDKRRIIRH